MNTNQVNKIRLKTLTAIATTLLGAKAIAQEVSQDPTIETKVESVVTENQSDARLTLTEDGNPFFALQQYLGEDDITAAGLRFNLDDVRLTLIGAQGDREEAGLRADFNYEPINFTLNLEHSFDRNDTRLGGALQYSFDDLVLGGRVDYIDRDGDESFRANTWLFESLEYSQRGIGLSVSDSGYSLHGVHTQWRGDIDTRIVGSLQRDETNDLFQADLDFLLVFGDSNINKYKALWAVSAEEGDHALFPGIVEEPFQYYWRRDSLTYWANDGITVNLNLPYMNIDGEEGLSPTIGVAGTLPLLNGILGVGASYEFPIIGDKESFGLEGAINFDNNRFRIRYDNVRGGEETIGIFWEFNF